MPRREEPCRAEGSEGRAHVGFSPFRADPPQTCKFTGYGGDVAPLTREDEHCTGAGIESMETAVDSADHEATVEWQPPIDPRGQGIGLRDQSTMKGGLAGAELLVDAAAALVGSMPARTTGAT